MNNNQPSINKQKLALNIALYTILAITLSAVVHFSKKYFETNYNKHNTAESNISLYKVPSDDISEDATLKQPKIIEPNPIDIHPEPTAIILDETIEEQPIEMLSETPNIDTSEKTNTIPKPEDSKKTQQTAPTNHTTVSKKTHSKKINIQKTKTKELKKPKTLAKPEPIAKSVLNNPLFHSFIIQTGAFTTSQDATAHRLRIKQNKILDKYTVDIIYSNNLHKVVIGYFEDSTTAQDVCTQLKKENVQCFATRI